MSAELRVDLRWMNPCDARRMAELDRSGFDDSWPESAYRLLWNVRGAYPFVAIHDGLIVGAAVWEARKASLLLLRLVVSPAYRRKGLGTILLGHVLEMLGDRRSTLIAAVDEGNLGGQMFLKSCGLIAYSDADAGNGRCYYLFRLRVEDRCECGGIMAVEG